MLSGMREIKLLAGAAFEIAYGTRGRGRRDRRGDGRGADVTVERRRSSDLRTAAANCTTC